MVFFSHIKTLVLRHLMRMGWTSALFSLLLYTLISWVGLWIFNEEHITDPHVFFYWLGVTASTVGFGDYSPQTDGGRWFVLLWVIPIGLSLFVTIVARIGVILTKLWQGGIMGEKPLTLQNHILVIGWDEQNSKRLLELLVRDESYRKSPREIALCVTNEITNPMPGDVEFVRVGSYTDASLAERTSLKEADCVIIDAESDHQTLAIALFVNTVNQGANLAVYFKNSDMEPLLTSVCPQAEVIPSVAVEMLAKSAMDPGSSALHKELLDVGYEQTQYSAQLTEAYRGKTVDALFTSLKQDYNATLIGVLRPGDRDIHVNPSLDESLEDVERFFYIADERITEYN